MPTNKQATIRYHALDKCFSNWGRRHYIEDLVEACNSDLFEYSGITEGVGIRQIYEDIRFMESDQGWSIPLDHIRDGKRVFFRYEDKSYSIKNQSINVNEVKQLKETLSLLTRFKGMPQFEWMDEILVRLETAFNLKTDDRKTVGFEQNPYLKGLHFFSDIFNSIQFRRVLAIEYKGFRQTKASLIKFHPYYLKQYNNRWFVFGHNELFGALSNLAIDRIISIKETYSTYIDNNEIDFEEYFEDFVGVSINKDKKPEKVILEISADLWPYIETKPIHGSQKTKAKEAGCITLELEVMINYELVSTIFSWGEGVKVIEPDELRNTIKNKAEKLLGIYK